MDISRYLAELIKTKKELAVPGLGTFYREQQPASYDAAGQRFLPPVERIAFKNEASGDDTLLKYISEAENKSPEDIKSLLEEYISNLHDLLSNTELIKIDHLGSFEKAAGGFSFEADPGLLSNSYYGLQAQPEIAASISSAMPKAVPVNEPATIIAELEEEEEVETTSGKGKTWLLLVAFLLTLVAGVQVFYPEWLSIFQQETPEAPKVSAPATPRVDTLATDSLTKTDSTAIPPKADTLVSVLPTGPSYEIVVAAFGKRSEADAFIQQLAQRGITARALPNRKKEYIKISVGSFTDEKLAQQELQRIHRELSKGAWIFKVKPQKQAINVSPTN